MSVQPPVNVLASRYASQTMLEVFSDDARVIMERELWIIVMEEQARLGFDIPESAIAEYKNKKTLVDHDSIRKREEVTRHDVKARIEEFNALAGHEYIHLGMTSRDATENVEQLQVLRGLMVVRDGMVAALARFADASAQHSDLTITGRSHNVAAQLTTLGKRFANYGEELLRAYERIESLIESYPLRGIKGPVGTQQDMLDMFDGDTKKVQDFESAVAGRLGFSRVLGSVGQVYPRSLDLEVVGALQQASAGPSSFAKTTRLMAGNELVTEGFKKGQVGSSAMPHKMNSRTSERINGFAALLAGYSTMASHLAGDQWNEGDVSCSVVRRVMIPDSFYATDGMLQALMTVLDEYGVFPEVIAKERDRYLPFLGTTKVLVAAVKAGAGREVAHEAIKEHAVAIALEMRESGSIKNDLLSRLGADDRLPINESEIKKALGDPLEMTGLARDQVADFVERVAKITSVHPDAAALKPGRLL